MATHGDTMMFSGGAEKTPIVKVTSYYCPGSMKDGDITFEITQEGKMIQLSPETMKDILKWYDNSYGPKR